MARQARWRADRVSGSSRPNPRSSWDLLIRAAMVFRCRPMEAADPCKGASSDGAAGIKVSLSVQDRSSCSIPRASIRTNHTLAERFVAIRAASEALATVSAKPTGPLATVPMPVQMSNDRRSPIWLPRTIETCAWTSGGVSGSERFSHPDTPRHGTAAKDSTAIPARPCLS